MTRSTTLLDPPRTGARLLSPAPADGNGDGEGWTSLARHRSHYVPPPEPGASPNLGLVDLVDRAGLAGRGGAGFPTARKLAAVAAGPGPRVVVANGAEGEPASAKDRLLLCRRPHLVVDGALWAASAVGASRVVICVDRSNGDALAALGRAVAERSSELVGVTVAVLASPARYVSGESSALVQWLAGGPAVPTRASAHRQGVDGRPTLVQNVETLAHLAQIANHGAEWFRSTGTPEEPGTSLVTVSGAVARPSVVEVPNGTPVADLLAACGGSTAPVQAMLIGGYFGAWVAAPAVLDAPYSRAGLRPLGAGPGAGVVVALPSDACGLAETARVLAWFAGESAGQCGPCLFGLPSLAAATTALVRGDVDPADRARLRRWADEIEGRGACRHPDGAVGLLRSALTAFARDVDRHAAGRPCEGAAGLRLLRVPRPNDGWR
jgi:NADH:ubiquinone oxidoreductase subunit F (NADH-binding)